MFANFNSQRFRLQGLFQVLRPSEEKTTNKQKYQRPVTLYLLLISMILFGRSVQVLSLLIMTMRCYAAEPQACFPPLGLGRKPASLPLHHSRLCSSCVPRQCSKLSRLSSIQSQPKFGIKRHRILASPQGEFSQLLEGTNIEYNKLLMAASFRKEYSQALLLDG